MAPNMEDKVADDDIYLKLQHQRIVG